MRHKALYLALCALTLFTTQAARAEYTLPYIGDQIEYKTHYEDTFVHLARDYNLGFTEMRAANPYVDPWLPGKNTKLILPTRHILPNTIKKGIIINLAEMRLYAYLGENGAPITFPIGVGREGLDTPVGVTEITRKKDGPTWRPTPRMRKEDPSLKAAYPPGDDNPLGTHALYLGWNSYAIHGTNRPFGIGRRISSGCIRMYPETITQLFDLVPTGTRVEIVNQPIKLAWIEDKLYLEAHPTLEQAVEFEERGVAPEQKLTDKEMKTLIKTAGPHQERLNWPAIRTALKERNGYPVTIARRPTSSKKITKKDSTENTPDKSAQKEQEDNKPPQKPLEDIYSTAEEEPEAPKTRTAFSFNQ